MNPSLQPYVSGNPVCNVTLSDAQKAKAFGDQYGFTSTIGAVKIDMEPGDPWTSLSTLQALGLADTDQIRFVLIYDKFMQDTHDVGALLKRLNNTNEEPMQRFKEFVADVCNTVSTNNPNAGADQDALVADLLSNIAAPAVVDSFKVLA